MHSKPREEQRGGQQNHQNKHQDQHQQGKEEKAEGKEQEQEKQKQKQQNLQQEHNQKLQRPQPSTQKECVEEKFGSSTSRRTSSSSSCHQCSLVGLPAALKRKISSFLSPKDTFTIIKTDKQLHDDLVVSQLPMKIFFKSWYGYTDDEGNEGEAYRDNHEQNFNVNDTTSSSNSTGMSNRNHHHYQRHRRKNGPIRGPKIPYLSNRTHSVTLTGSWSHQGYGHWRGEFYVIAHKKENYSTISRNLHNGDDKKKCLAYDHRLPFDGGRVVWASPLENTNLWSKLTLSFVPRNDEVYYLYIKPGPGGMMLGNSVHVSNLIAHVIFYDDFGYILTKHYKTIVRHISNIEELGKYNRGAYYTRILEAVARSIRIQLAKSNALDPVLEHFFQSIGTKHDTASLLVLEEIARFLSEHACINERRNYMKTNNEDENNLDAEFNNSNNLRRTHSVYGAGCGDSIPDWIPYADSSSPFGGYGTTTSGGDSSRGSSGTDHHHHHHTAQPTHYRQQQRNVQQHQEQIVTKSLRGVRRRLGKCRRIIQRFVSFKSTLLFRPRGRRRLSEFSSTQFTTAMETAGTLEAEDELEQEISVDE